MPILHDLASGFHQIEIDPKAVQTTARVHKQRTSILNLSTSPTTPFETINIHILEIAARNQILTITD